MRLRDGPLATSVRLICAMELIGCQRGLDRRPKMGAAKWDHQRRTITIER
jgi:hypothetical protein